MDNQVSLRESLKKDFGIDFPISGGDGRTIDNPIIVHREKPNDYTSVEYALVKYLVKQRGLLLRMGGQTLMSRNGRKIDQIGIMTKTPEGDIATAQDESYFFDITECMSQ